MFCVSQAIVLGLGLRAPRPKTLSITKLRSGADISLSDKSNPIWSKLTGFYVNILFGRALKVGTKPSTTADPSTIQDKLFL